MSSKDEIELNIKNAEVNTLSKPTEPSEPTELFDAKKVQAHNKKQTESTQNPTSTTEAKSCKRCGHVLANDVVSVTEEDKAAFLKSLIGDVPYEKNFEILNKKVTVALQTLPVWFSNLIKDHLVYDHKAGNVQTAEDYRAHLFLYYGVGAIKQISFSGIPKYTRKDEILDKTHMNNNGSFIDAPLTKECTSITDLWAEPILIAVLEVVALFYGQVELMTRHASSDDFWQSVPTN